MSTNALSTSWWRASGRPFARSIARTPSRSTPAGGTGSNWPNARHIAGALTLAALGFALGLAVSSTSSRRGPVDGMCIALDMAMGHGLIDEVGRARVEDAISSPSNPYFDRVPVKPSELRRACVRIAADRWNW